MNLTNQKPYLKNMKRKRAKPNDKHYLVWLRTQPSAFSGISRNVIAAHYRTAKNSGISIKPLFSAIPLTHQEHIEQHRIGQFKFAGRNWWEETVKNYQLRFIMQGGEIAKEYKI